MPTFTVSQAIDFVTLVGMVVAIAISINRNKREARVDDAEAAFKYAEIARNAADQASNMIKRIEELECEVMELKTKSQAYEKRIIEWEAGINLLIMQIVALGKTPVWKPNDDSNKFSETSQDPPIRQKRTNKKTGE